MTRDLTQGPVWKSLMLFYLPMFVTSALQQIYSTVDAIIVGQFVGKSGLAAIDAVSEFGRIPVNFAIGLAAGAAILIAQDFGAKRFGKLADTAKSAFVLSLFIGLIFSITGFLAAPWVARVMDVPADILDGSLIYLRIYFAGMVFNLLYNMGAGIMRAFGNSRTPMFVLAISGGLNVLLDLLFVGPLQMGIAGAALATVISQVVSCVLVIFLLYHCKDDSLPDLRSGCFSMVIIRKVITTGLPTAIRSALWPVANTIIHSAINGLGTDVIAAWSVNNKLTTLMWLAIDSLGPSVMTFVGQNFGAGDLKLFSMIGAFVGPGDVVLVMAVLGMLWCFKQFSKNQNRNSAKVFQIFKDLKTMFTSDDSSLIDRVVVAMGLIVSWVLYFVDIKFFVIFLIIS